MEHAWKLANAMNQGFIFFPKSQLLPTTTPLRHSLTKPRGREWSLQSAQPVVAEAGSSCGVIRHFSRMSQPLVVPGSRQTPPTPDRAAGRAYWNQCLF